MKKILIMLILSVSTVAMADIVSSSSFRFNIPQPDRITNGDFDGDGILDAEDSTPFGGVDSGSGTGETVADPIPAPTGALTFNVAELGTGATYSASSTLGAYGDDICGLFDNNDYNGVGNTHDAAGTYTGSRCARGIWLPANYTAASSGWIQIDNPIAVPIFAIELIPYYSISRHFDMVEISYSINGGSSYIPHQTIIPDSYYEFVTFDEPIPANVTNIRLEYTPNDPFNGDYIEMDEIRLLSSEEYRL